MSKVDGKQQEVVAWRWRKHVVNNQSEAIGETDWVLRGEPKFLPWWTNESPIRLSDYEALKTEIEIKDAEIVRLREALKDIQNCSSIDFFAMRSGSFELTARLGYIHQTAVDALAQEQEEV